MKTVDPLWYYYMATKTTQASLDHLAMRAHLADSDPDFLFLSADEQEERIVEQLERDAELGLVGFAC